MPFNIEYEDKENYSDFGTKLIAEIETIFEDEFLKAVDDLQRNSPVGVSSQIGEPSLKESWDLSITDDPRGDFTINISNKAIASLFRLEGRGPGKFPPVGSLDDWVKIKLSVAPNKVKSVSFLIGRKIAAKGTNRGAYRNFREFNLDTGDPAPNGAIDRAIKRINKRLDSLEL